MSHRPSLERSFRASVVLVAIATLVPADWPSQAAAPATGSARTALAAPAASQATAAELERLTATVRAFDPRAGTLDLVTGVGMALRVRRVHLPAQMKVKVDGAESPASVLTPGCIVRAECRHAAGATVAYKVELVQAAPRGRRP